MGVNSFIKAWRMFWATTGAAYEQIAMACWDIEDLFHEKHEEHTLDGHSDLR